MKMYIKIIIFFISILIVYTSQAMVVPKFINVQGKISPVPTPLPSIISVNFYQNSSADRSLLEKAIAIPSEYGSIDSNGVFNLQVSLDREDGTLLEFIDDHEYWLAVKVEGIGRLPLNQIVAVPFAVTAKNVRGGTGVFNGRSFIGLYSEGAVAGGVFSSEAGIAVAGFQTKASTDGSPLPGYLGVGPEAMPVGAIAGKAVSGVGVSGFSRDGSGVFGLTLRTNDDAAGVYGLSFDGVGVKGASTTGRGIYGTGGLYGVSGIGYSAISCGVFGYMTDILAPSTTDVKLPFVGLGREALPVAGVGGRTYDGHVGVSGLSAKGFGVFGTTLRTDDETAAGVGGWSFGPGPAIWGQTSYANGIGVKGTADDGIGIYGSGGRVGGKFESSGTALEVVGSSELSYIPAVRVTRYGERGEGIYAENKSANNFDPVIDGYSMSVNSAGIAIRGAANYGTGVKGGSERGTGIWGEGNTYGIGVYGVSTNNIGVKGRSARASGIEGASTDGIGVEGRTTNNAGVQGTSTNGVGVSGNGARAGVYGNTIAAGNLDSPFKVKTFDDYYISQPAGNWHDIWRANNVIIYNVVFFEKRVGNYLRQLVPLTNNQIDTPTDMSELRIFIDPRTHDSVVQARSKLIDEGTNIQGYIVYK